MRRDVKRAAVNVVACVSSIVATHCVAAAGDADTTFGTGGYYLDSQVSGLEVTAGPVVTLSGGRLLSLAVPARGTTSLSRPAWPSPTFALTGDGTLDTTFAVDGLLPVPSTDTRRYSGAREIAGGRFVTTSNLLFQCGSYSSCSRNNQAADLVVEMYDRSGRLVPSYGVAGAATSPLQEGGAAILSDGTVVALGVTWSERYGEPAAPGAFNATVVLADGQRDVVLSPAFAAQMRRCGTPGTGPLQTPPSVAVTPDDRIVFAWRGCMLRLLRDATPDPSFGQNGMSLVDNLDMEIESLFVLGDSGTLTFSRLPNSSSFRVIKRLASGAPDASFGVRGVIASFDVPFAALPGRDPRNRILMVGGSQVARYGVDLKLDQSFGPDGTGVVAVPTPQTRPFFAPGYVSFDERERILIAGTTGARRTCSGFDCAFQMAVARLQADADATSSVIEFYNAALDHYFITWIPAEIAELDAGTRIKGWQRTGQRFRLHTAAQPGVASVCRIYQPPGYGDSHFYGRGTDECNATMARFPKFVLEDAAFMYATLPTTGACPSGMQPIYRVWSNRADSNHRYLTNRALRDDMVKKGWIVEGDGADAVVMCAW